MDDTTSTVGHRPAYPLRRRRGDERFTMQLVCDVAAVLIRHGYPPVATANDLIHLQNRLYDALYQPKGNP